VNVVCISHIFRICVYATCTASLVLFDIITLEILGEVYKL
jgi:hypothetical protein